MAERSPRETILMIGAAIAISVASAWAMDVRDESNNELRMAEIKVHNDDLIRNMADQLGAKIDARLGEMNVALSEDLQKQLSQFQVSLQASQANATATALTQAKFQGEVSAQVLNLQTAQTQLASDLRSWLKPK